MAGELRGKISLNDGTVVVRPAVLGGSVEIAVSALNQPGWIVPIREGTAKRVKTRVGAAGTDPKYGAQVRRPTGIRRSIEIAVAALDKLCAHIGTIGGRAEKGVKICLRLCIGIERSTRQDQRNNCDDKAEQF